MTAVAESALLSERRDVGEADVDCRLGLPQLQLPQSRCVYHAAALIEDDELAVHAGVSAARIPLAHVARLQNLSACKRINQGRLPRS